MTTKDNLMLCTIRELATFLTNSISISDVPDSFCPNVDFSVINDDAEKDINKIYDNANGWYGLKVIDAGFDSNCLNIIVDYYGGFCASFLEITPDDCEKGVEKALEDAIINTLECQEGGINRNTFLIVEIVND